MAADSSLPGNVAMMLGLGLWLMLIGGIGLIDTRKVRPVPWIVRKAEPFLTPEEMHKRNRGGVTAMFAVGVALVVLGAIGWLLQRIF